MSVFDAGTIEATLDLDRTPFTRGLEMARLQAEAFERNHIVATVDVDSGAAIAQLAALKKIKDAADNDDIDIDVDVHNERAISDLGSQRLQTLLLGTAITTLGTAAIPIFGALTGGVLALSSAFTSAGLGAGVLTLGIVGHVTEMVKSIKAVAKAEEAVKKAQEELAAADTTAEREAATKKLVKAQKELRAALEAQEGPMATAIAAWETLTATWDKFQEHTAKDAFGIIAVSLGIANDLLKRATPIWDAFLKNSNFMGILERLQDWVNGPTMDRLADFIGGIGGRNFARFLEILGDLGNGFLEIMMAFGPFSETLMGGLVTLAQSFSDWAKSWGDSEGFQSFIDWLVEVGPKVWAFVSALAGAVVSLAIALAPLGIIVLEGVTSFLQFIADMDPDTLAAIATGLTVLAAGIYIVNTAMAIFTALSMLNPWVLLVIAILAVIAALAALYFANEDFRKKVDETLVLLQGYWQTFLDFMNTYVVPLAVWQVEQIAKAWDFLTTYIFPILTLLATITVQIFYLIGTTIATIMDGINLSVVGGFEGMPEPVASALRYLLAVVQATFGPILAIISGVMSGLGIIVSAGWQNIKTIFFVALIQIRLFLAGVLQALRGDWSGAMAYFRTFAQNQWNLIKQVFFTSLQAISAFFGAQLRAMRATVGAIFSSIVAVIRANLNLAAAVVRANISGIAAIIRSFGGILYNAGASIFRSFVQGIYSMINPIRAAVSTVMAVARALIPGSPAKEGPFSGKGWVLYSGQAVGDAWAAGMLSRLGTVQDAASKLASSAYPATGGPDIGTRTTQALTPVPTGRSIAVSLVSHNPLPEATSQTAVKKITELANLGVFG